MRTEEPITVELTPAQWVIIVKIARVLYPKLTVQQAIGCIIAEAVREKREGSVPPWKYE